MFYCHIEKIIESFPCLVQARVYVGRWNQPKDEYRYVGSVVFLAHTPPFVQSPVYLTNFRELKRKARR